MINKAQAQKIVEEIIRDYETAPDDAYVVIESATIEKEWGWVFFYSSKKWIETGALQYAVAGNAPFFVLRENGKVLISGTAYPVEYYIERFEATGDPDG